jgi:hypothetical protein
MTSPWQASNPEPNDPGEIPLLAHPLAILLIAICALIAVFVFTWPSQQSFGQDFGSFAVFGIQSSLIASGLMIVYGISIVIATIYEPYPGRHSIRLEVLASSGIGIVAPWIGAVVLVIGLTVLLFLVNLLLGIAHFFVYF